MSGFRAGRFQRHLVFGVVRPFCPAHAVHSLQDVDPVGLANRGIKLIMIDVDNTLVQWRTEDFAQETLDWVAKVKSLGLNIIILSNTRNPERLQRLAKTLDIPALRGKFKPNPAMYKEALQRFNVKESQAVMIGDQIFTDIFGANRAGIEGIWLQPISKRDFVGTKVSRFGERVLRGYLYRSLMTPQDDEPELPEEVANEPIWERKIVRQLVKFCIVGGLSFAIDYCIRMTILFAPPFSGWSIQGGAWLQQHASVLFAHAENPTEAFVPIAATCSASVAILNSFFWNRMWTFNIRGSEDRGAQLRRFFLISLIGLVLNVLITSFVTHVLPGPSDSKPNLRIATVVAAMIVAMWNFTGQRLYAFRSSNRKPKA
jgi:HAD superfamily phosphatase (TIGR01668 family)